MEKSLNLRLSRTRVSNLLLALFLVFTAQTIAADEIARFEFGHNNNDPSPRRDPQFGGEEVEWITYDDGSPASIVEELENYYSRVTFTPESEFELQFIHLMVLNDGPNDRAPCYVYVYEQDRDNNLAERPVAEMRINRLDEWNSQDIDDNWTEVRLPRAIRFEAEQSFSIIYGPAPCGEREGQVQEGDGWWNIFDRQRNEARSFVARRLDRDHRAWTDFEINGDLLLRAGGVFISDNNSPEWAEDPEDISVNEGDRIEFEVIGRDPDDDNELEIEYVSQDIPDEAEFSYEQEDQTVSGRFYWQTTYEDDGDYVATFLLRDEEDEVSLDVRISIANVNQRSRWIEPPEEITVNEGALIRFWLLSEDPDGDRIRMGYRSDDLPREAGFRDYGRDKEGNYRGLFTWQTTHEDEGEYTAEFVADDDNDETLLEVSIIVRDDNRPPEWIDYPEDRVVEGYIDDRIIFELIAEDPEEQDIEIEWEWVEEPDDEPATEVDIEAGRVQFEMRPELGQHGDYQVRFIVSDGEEETAIEIVINIHPDYFRYVDTGHGHTVQLTRIFLFGEELESGEDDDENLDEIGIITPNDVVAGALRFGDANQGGDFEQRGGNLQFRSGWSTTAWGQHGQLPGFRRDEIFNFLYWDYEAEEEYDVQLRLVTGDSRWRRNGLSVFELIIGPALTVSPDVLNFGEVRVDDQTILNVTFVSSGSMPIEHFELEIEGDGFSIGQDIPDRLDVGARLTVPVTFEPDQTGEFHGTLNATGDDIEVSRDLNGVGILRGHFEYEITEVNHRIDVIQAALGGNPLDNSDEIGVFTTNNLCAGAVIVADNDHWAFPAWGDDPETDDVDGFREDEQMRFKIWDNSAREEYDVNAVIIRGEDRWSERGYTAVTLNTSDNHFDWARTETVHNIVVETGFEEGDEIAVVTPRGIVAGGCVVGDERPYVFDAYGDNPQTQDIIEGFLDNEQIYFRIWLRESEREFMARAEWVDGSPRWHDTERSVVELRPTDENRAPRFRRAHDYNIREGQDVEFAVIATDPDHDPVSLTLIGDDLPENAQFTDRGNGGGVFTWRPENDQEGNYTARFTAFDGDAMVELRVSIRISNANQPPELAEIEDIEINEGERLSLQLEAEDPDNDRLGFSAQNLPYGSSLEDDLFRWTPNSEQSGEYEVTFRVTDFGQPPQSDETTVTITVNDDNQPPVWAEIDDIVILEGERVRFTIRASDLDDRNFNRRQNNLQLSAGNLPEQAEFTDRRSGRGDFEWQTDIRSAGDYHPYFVAFDGELRDTLVVNITVQNRNRPPRFERIHNQTVTVGDTLDLSIHAVDGDPGDQVELGLFADNIPDGAEFTDLGEGDGRFLWIPSYNRRGVYANVLFTAIDSDGARDVARVQFTVRVIDREPPVISDISPENSATIQTNQPTIEATIIDALSGIRDIDFRFDNHRINDFDFEDGVFSWTPDEELSEGAHRFIIRAVDDFRNNAGEARYFIVDSDAGEIEVNPLPEYTRRESIIIYGTAEPSLTVELWRDDERLMQIEADRRGQFRFDDVSLNEGLNEFTFMGGDENNNVARSAEASIYLDVEPPEIEFIAPELYTRSRTPEIVATIVDVGVGISEGDNMDQFRREEGGIELVIDGNTVNNFRFADGRLTYTVDRRRPLSQGGHIVSLTAIDRLGNSHEEPVQMRFFVDFIRPTAEHRFLDDAVDTISNRSPEFTIPVSDPRPPSGINIDGITLTLDDDELDFSYNEREGSVSYHWSGRPLRPGMHELAISLVDRAGNEYDASGRFFLTNRRDREPPYFRNLYPPPGAVAGQGVREGEGCGFSADTIRFVFGDDDAGPNEESLWMYIVAFNGPGDRDNDTTYFGRERMMVMQGGVVRIPLNSHQGLEIGRDDMPGLEEGLNEVNVFGADDDDNEEDEGWQYFYDDSPPDPPVLDELDNQYVNESEMTFSGTTGGDSPDYEEDYDNEPYVHLYRSDTLSAEVAVEYEAEFNVEGLLLNEGWNSIYAIVVDGGGNESDHSDTLRVFLDLSEPVIEQYTATGGEHLATEIPEFTARLTDVGAGVDPDNILLTIGDVELPVAYDEDSNEILAQVQEGDELGNGEYTARLIVYDLAGNPDTSGFDFDIDLDPVDPPSFTSFETYTSINQVSLAGEGEVETTIVVFLNDEEIGEVYLADSAIFEFKYTAPSLSDTSQVDMIARNPAGTESEHTDPETLVVDIAPPEFSDVDPGNGAKVEATTFEEIRLFVSDLISGIDPDGFALQMNEEDLDFEPTETDDGFWLVANVSEMEFGDGETVEMVANALDCSNTANEGELAWEFVVTINDAPVVALPDTSFDEDTELTLDLSDYITDDDDSFADLELTVEVLEGGNEPSATIDDERLLHLLAGDDWFGDLRFTVQATDTSDVTGADTVIVVVSSINDSPSFTSVPENTTALTGEEFNAQLEAADVDPGDALTYNTDTDLFVISEEGVISFTPDEEMLGQHTIELYVSDEAEESDIAEFNLFIAAPNQEVEITHPIQDVSIDEDSDPSVIADLDNVFTDPEEADINFLVEYGGDGISIEIDAETNVATLSLDTDFFGDVEVTLSADDLEGSQVADVFIVEVTNVNDPPEQVGLLPDLILIEEDVGRTVIVDLDTVFVDIEDDDMIFSWENGDHLGVDIDDDLVLSIITDDDWAGEESFTLSVDDGIEPEGVGPRRDEISSLEITVEVEAVNDAPRVSVDDPFIIEMNEDQDPLVIETLIADLFNDPDEGDVFEVSWDVLEGPVELSFDEAEEHIIATIVEENYNGEYEYTITATDLSDEEGALTLVFSIIPVNDPPEVIEAIGNVTISEDADPRRIDIANLGEIFTDIDGDALIFSFAEVPGQLNMDIDDDNVLFITPDNNYNIENGITITVSADDDDGGQMVARLGTAGLQTGSSDLRNVGPVRQIRSVGRTLLSDSDAPSLGQSQTRVSDLPQTHSSRLDTPVRQSTSQTGMSDLPGRGGEQTPPRRDDSEDTEFDIVIDPVNDPPYWIETDNQSGNENTIIEFTVTSDDVDRHNEGDVLTLTITDDDGLIDLGALFDDNGDGTGDFSWQTDYEDAGVYNPQFRVQDEAGETDLMSVEITIIHVNRQPVWNDVPQSINISEEEEAAFTVDGSDPDGDDVTIEAVSDDLPEGWEFTDNNDGTGNFNWTSGFEDEGSYTVVFTIYDDEFETVEDVIITVGDVNRSPTWDDIQGSAEVNEAQQLVIEVAASDPDGDDVTITWESTGGADIPSDDVEFTDNGDGTESFTWTPNYDNAGSYTATFTVSDEEFNVSEDVSITVIHLNRTSIWDNVPDNEEVNETAQLEFTVEASDPDGDDLDIVYSSDNIPGSAEFTDNNDGTGSFTWTPTYDDAGEYTATFTVSDDEFNVEADVTITVIHVNRTPVWDEISENESVNEGQELEFIVVSSDPDADNLEIAYSSNDIPDNAEFTDNGDGTGTFIWTPTYDNSGEYTTTFTVSDNEFDVVEDVIVTVSHVNRTPIWDNIHDSEEVNEAQELNVNITASDPDGDDLVITYNSIDIPDAAEFIDNGDGTGTFTWTPTYDNAGNYTATFTVTDGSFEVESDVSITVIHVNRTPVWDDIPESESVDAEDVLEFSVTGSDPDGDDLTIVYSSDDIPDNAEFTDNGDGTGTFIWTPTDDNVGNYTALFTLSDNGFNVAVEVSISVDYGNRAPVWDNVQESVEVDEGEELLLTVEGSDPDGDDMTITWESTGETDIPVGEIEFTDNSNGTATFNWTPTYEGEGVYIATFTIADDEFTVEADVSITVVHVNLPPDWDSISESEDVNEDQELAIIVEGSDPDGDNLTIDYNSDDIPDGAEFTDNGDGTGTFVWTPGYDDEGDYTAAFTISDGQFSVEEDVLITVNHTNQAPVWDDVSQDVGIDEADELEFTITASDPDGDDVSIAYISDDITDDAEFTDNGDGSATFVWTPGYEDAGEYTAVFTVLDDEFEIETSVDITVIHINRTPVWDDAPETASVNEGLYIEIIVEGSDPDDDQLDIDISVGDLPDGWDFTDHRNGTGTFTWTPTYNDAGEYPVTFTISDGAFEVDAEIAITVVHVNRTPVWDDTPGSVSINENEQLEFNVEASDPDGDDMMIAYSSERLPDGAEFTDNADGTGTFTWMTSFNDEGNYTATFTLSDDEFEVVAEASISVGGVNRTPVWDNVPGAVEVGENEEIAFTVESSDPDGNDLTVIYSSDDIPDEVEFTDNGDGTADFTWTPTYENAGGYTAMFTVTDDDFEVEAEVTITIIDVNRAPTISDPSDEDNYMVEGNELDEVFIEFYAVDPDDDDPTWSLLDEDDLPDGWEFTDYEDGSAEFIWTPEVDERGEYNPIFRVTDGRGGSDDIQITLSIDRPLWGIEVPDDGYFAIEGNENEELTVHLTSYDPYGYNPTWRIGDDGGLPGGWEFNDNLDGTADFAWTPGFEDAADEYDLVIELVDVDVVQDAHCYITVFDINRTPVWGEITNSYEVDEGELLEFTVNGNDPDGDDVTIEYRSDDLPEAVEFTDNGDGTGTLFWEPNFEEAGDYTAVFILSDDEFDVETEVNITVIDVNREPVWDAPDPGDPIRSEEGDDVSFDVQAHDPDGDDITIELTDRGDLPDDAEFSDNEDGTGHFSWHTGFDDEGQYNPIFTVSDAELDCEVEIIIAIGDVNLAPIWDAPDPDDPIIGEENEEIVFEVQTHDPDGDDITIELTDRGGLPDEAVFTDNGEGTGSFAWTPTFDDAGEYTPVFTISDEELERDVELIITVAHVNRTPEFGEYPELVESDEGETIEFSVSGADPDGDDLTISYNGQTGMSVLPDEVEFVDNGDGSGSFVWEATFEDAGEYTALFELSDGDMTDEI
ncbi:MAG: Ig-like domain-containing protein, partial [Candidatus Hatepunaea meridiana]|nr:Ig-like domain-containing protein [Candidatus Hatepunaea meridiana]